MSNFVNVSSSPAWAMMASAASINKFSVSKVTSKVMGKFKSGKSANHFMRKLIDGRNIESSVIMNMCLMICCDFVLI
jgi:hypothetical protein